MSKKTWTLRLVCNPHEDWIRRSVEDWRFKETKWRLLKSEMKLWNLKTESEEIRLGQTCFQLFKLFGLVNLVWFSTKRCSVNQVLYLFWTIPYFLKTLFVLWTGSKVFHVSIPSIDPKPNLFTMEHFVWAVYLSGMGDTERPRYPIYVESSSDGHPICYHNERYSTIYLS